MMTEAELIEIMGQLQHEVLRRWIDHGWVRPELVDGAAQFDASDVARVRLICELHYELRIEEDSLPVMLSLMDQLYSVRQSMRKLLSAVEAQPEDVRKRIATLMQTQTRS